MSDVATDPMSVRVADHLRTAILEGTIAPGERIRQEAVASELGASRLPVREALRMLVAEGLAEHEPNRGARVPFLSQHEVDVIYQMRERLEPLALVQSLPHLSDDDVAELGELQDRIEGGVDVETFLELDREFHLRSYRFTGSDDLDDEVVRLWNSTQHYRRTFMNLRGEEGRPIVNAEHRLLVDAIGRRDAVDAERILSGHIRRTRIELSHHPEIFRSDS